METPIIFIIFKRPDTTQRVFEVIRQAKPSTLIVIADGARDNRTGEAEECAAARAIIDQVDWKCEVLKNYSSINLGCGKRVSSGLDWAFSQVPEAIILEDDCVVHPTFFQFCTELLEHYRYDTRVFSISAQNPVYGYRTQPYSYRFSRYHHCWGWATWRRAWNHFALDLPCWRDVLSEDLLKDVLQNDHAVSSWRSIIQAVYDGQIDSWAIPWTLTCWLQSGLSIHPSVNLVENIGFGKDATHTRSKTSSLDSLPMQAVEFPLQHPPYLIRDVDADEFEQRHIFNIKSSQKLKQHAKKIIKQLLFNQETTSQNVNVGTHR